LEVTGAQACASQATAEVLMDDAAPGATAQGGTLTCTTTSIALMGSGNGTFAWTGPNGFTSVEQNPTVSVAGTYTLVVTGANGCTDRKSAVEGKSEDARGARAVGGKIKITTASSQLM